MVGKEEKEEELAWTFLEIVYFRLSNTWVGAEEEDATKGGRDECWRQ